MSVSITQTIRAWLIAIGFAIVLFLSSIAIEALSDDFKEKLKPYRLWVWGILGLGLIVAVAGAIRELKNQRDSKRSAENRPTPTQKHIETGDVSHSIQNTGDNNTVNQASGGAAHLTLTFNNNLLGPQEIRPSGVNKQYADELTNVEWENRDNDLLKKYFSLCPADDDQYRGYENWQERTIRERLFISGFAFEGLNGHTYLTREGVIFCCQHGQIPQATLFVDVRLKYDDVDREEAIPYNNYSILALYFKLLERLTPLFQQGIELPDVRDSSGSAILVYEYPRLAIIEALVNFLIHRDYSQDDMGYITIYPDRVVFENPSQSEIPIEELLSADVALKPKYCRNQRLIQAFSYARLNQREGRGIQRIKEALEKRFISFRWLARIIN